MSFERAHTQNTRALYSAIFVSLIFSHADKKLTLTSITEKYLKIITGKNLLLKLPVHTFIFNRTYM